MKKLIHSVFNKLFWWRRKKSVTTELHRVPPGLTTNLEEIEGFLALAYRSDLTFTTTSDIIRKCEIYDPLNDLTYSLEQRKGGPKFIPVKREGQARSYSYIMKSESHPSGDKILDNHQLPGGDYQYIAHWKHSSGPAYFKSKFIVSNKPLEQEFDSSFS